MMLSGLHKLALPLALALGLASLGCGSPSAPQAPVTTSAARPGTSAAPVEPPPDPHRPFGKLEDVRPGSGFGSPCYAHAGSLYRYEISGDRTAPWKIVRIDLDSRKESDIWRGESMGDLSFDDGGVIKVVDRGVVRIPLAGGPSRLYQLEGAADAAADKGQIWVRRVREVGDRGPTTELVRIATDTGIVTQVATLGPGLVTSTKNLFLSPTAIAVVSAPRRRLLVLDRAKPVLP
ncbi:MAG: hypothetical protein HOV80_17550, partial [Polyangiaceae bacterium]|nr:hypothetical protein [Polyangiaceae bacterium]